jgi:membrane fusion protein (multidrug efflux system)
MNVQAISKQEYDNALAESDQSLADIEIAKAAVKTAHLNLEYTKVLCSDLWADWVFKRN